MKSISTTTYLIGFVQINYHFIILLLDIMLSVIKHYEVIVSN